MTPTWLRAKYNGSVHSQERETHSFSLERLVKKSEAERRATLECHTGYVPS